MANKSGMNDPNRSQGRHELDASELDDMIREQAREGDPDADRVQREKEKEEKVEDRVEPEVSVEPRRPEKKVEEEDPLKKALSTIENLSREVETLKSRQTEIRGEVTRGREPSIEFEEVLPNVRLPKDVNQWPIRLTDKDLENLGLDPSAAKGLNVLANALYAFIMDTVPSYTTQQFVGYQNQREARTQRETAFFEDFPDLKAHRDVLELVETPEFFNSNKGIPIKQYFDRLGTAARGKIAAIRGVSLEDYTRSVSSNVRQTGVGSRAVVSSGGGSNRSTRRAGDSNAKEMDDMWEG